MEGFSFPSCAQSLSAVYCQFAKIIKWLFKISSTWLGPIKRGIGWMLMLFPKLLVPLQ